MTIDLTDQVFHMDHLQLALRVHASLFCECAQGFSHSRLWLLPRSLQLLGAASLPSLSANPLCPRRSSSKAIDSHTQICDHLILWKRFSYMIP